jgi:hypothetical protein
MLNDELIQGITITRDSLGITRQQFSTILLLGNTKTNSDDIKEYTSLLAIKNDGFAAETSEYKAASVISLQEPTVTKIIIAQKKLTENWSDLYTRYKNSGKYAYSVILANNVTEADPIISDNALKELALAIETNKQVFAINITADKINLAEEFKQLGYKRCLTVFKDANNDFPNAAILGKILPLDPGTVTLSLLKDLKGVIPAELDRAKQAEYESKNINYYDYITNTVARISPNCGKVANGDAFEVVYTEDWIITTIKENLINLFLSKPIIPYNSFGCSLIALEISSALTEGVNRGVIEPLDKDAVNMPTLASISQQDKVAGILNNVRFKFKLTGSIKKIGYIYGTVTW